MKKKNLKTALFYIVMIVGILIAMWVFLDGSKSPEKITYSDITELFQKEQVKTFEVSADNVIKLKTVDDKLYIYEFRDINIFYQDFGDLILEQKYKGIITEYDFEPIEPTPWWVSLLPTLAIIILLIVGWVYMMKQLGGGKGSKIGSFGKSKAKVQSNTNNKVLFADVAGADEEKEELTEIVDFLRDPAKYTKLGAKIPHGVLLVGPPGTGKTLLAKAVAGEAGVPFFSISGSDFVEMYVGVGASRVRDLFDTAKKHPASIIFIDEIDAVGRHRGAGLGGGHDEREQTLNQLLVEMDGFGSADGIIVIAATNRPDILDPALLRPGRFDRRVTVNYPDLRGREAILRVHSRNKPFEDAVDFRKIAQTTVGFTGADIANLLNESALLAARRGKSLIGMDEIEDSYMKILVGPKKKSKVRQEKDNRLTAYHEAGHAVASFFCKHSDPVKHITIIPAGNAGGVTVRVPDEDQSYDTRNRMFEYIIICLGGRIAEELRMDDISTGASADIQQATAVARSMVTKYGMSDKLGTVLYGSEHGSDEVFLGRDFSSGKNYSEKTAAEIDDEIREFIDRAYNACKKILSDNIDKLDKLAEYLLKAETVDGDQFKALMERDASFEELDSIAEDKRKKSDEENNEQRRVEEEKRIQEEKEAEERARKLAEEASNGMNIYGQYHKHEQDSTKDE